MADVDQSALPGQSSSRALGLAEADGKTWAMRLITSAIFPLKIGRILLQENEAGASLLRARPRNLTPV
jgi:hypothetical protein